MITKLEQFCNVASRTITVNNRIVPVEVRFDKKTKKYSIKDQKKVAYQVNLQNDDQTLEDKYINIKPAIDAYHRWYMEERLLTLVRMPEDDYIIMGKKPVTKKSFLAQIEALIDKPVKVKIEKKDCKVLHQNLSSYLKMKNDTFFTSGLEFKNLEEAKFLNPDTDEKNSKKKKSGELKRFLDDIVSVSYFNKEKEHNEREREAALKVMNSYDSKMYSNCHGLLKARLLMYESDGKSISIPYRCIAHNIPRYRKGLSIFNKAIALGNVFDLEKLNTDFKEQLKDLSELSGREITSVTSIFGKELYICYMTHRGISILNTIIGRDSKIGSEKEGLNQYINKYNQSVKSSKKKGEEKPKTLAMIDPLHDLILYGKKVVYPQLQDYSEVKPKIKKVVDSLKKTGAFDGHVRSNKIASLLDSLSTFDNERLNHIYVNSKAVSRISTTLFGDWAILSNAVPCENKKKQLYVSLQALNTHIRKHSENGHKAEEYFSLCKVNSIEKENETEDVFEMLRKYYEKFAEDRILQYTQIRSQDKIETIGLLMDAIKRLSIFLKTLSVGLPMDDADGLFYSEYKKYWDIIKEFDADYDLIRNFFYKKPFNTDKLRLHFGIGEDLLSGWTEQNHKNTNRIEGHGTRGHAYLFREKHQIDDEYDYYLGIGVGPGSDILFSEKLPERQNTIEFRKQLEKAKDLCSLERFCYYRMDGKTFGGQNYKSANGDVVRKKDADLISFIQKFIKDDGNETLNAEYDKYPKDVSSSDKDGITQNELMALVKEHDSTLFDKMFGDSHFIELYKQMLDRWKKAFEEAKQIPKAQEYAHKEYKDKNTGYKESYQKLKEDIEEVTRKLVRYIPVSWEELNETVSKGKLYLFRITNKDLSYAQSMQSMTDDGKPKRESRGKENLHTMYFRAVMDEFQDTFDIGADGEIFFRKATDAKKLERTPTHGKNKEGEVVVTCKSAEKLGEPRTMKCELTKDKHYTEDHYEFHLPMTLNYKPETKQNVFKDGVVEYLKYNCAENEDKESLHVIGVDRGERNLLYVTMIDMDGNIKYQKSLNEIVSKGVSPNGEAFEARVDYHKLAETRADEMRRHQKRYGIPLKMKEIKEGHLALAVHEIVNLMIDNHAILVMEDLNEGFMRSRQSQLTNVYQQFENKLISKLQFCVKDKKLDPNAPGGLYKAYQLAGPQGKGNRNGFVFFVPAWMTSKIDPVTGFVNLFCFNYKNEESSAQFFKTFKSITKNPRTGEYEFVFRYEDFKDLKVLQNATTPNVEWCVTSYGKRIERLKETNGFKYNEIDNLTKKFDELFAQYNIDTDADIKEQIVSINSKPLYVDLIKLIKLMLQMRNSGKINMKEYDYIISPVADPITGKHFDSTKYGELEKDKKEINSYPNDADANGAYNIARKGLIAVRQLIAGSKNFKIENKDWLEEAQKNMPKYSE